MHGAGGKRNDAAGNGTLFFVVIVLYRMHAEASPAFQTVQDICRMPSFRGVCEVLLWDNSPEWQPVPDDFEGTIVRDPANPGLAVAYNRALHMAAEREIPWLVLLDQDTPITDEYLLELVQTAGNAPAGVSVVLPQLLHRGQIVSPAFLRAAGPSAAYAEEPGLAAQGKPVQGFNSGAAVRVAAMQAIGGFDLRFPLDYLDHATLAALRNAGGGTWVLHARLEHSLSSDTGKASTPVQRSRQESVLSARRRFLNLYGSKQHRLLFPLKALREASSLLVHKGDVAGAIQVLRHLLSS